MTLLWRVSAVGGTQPFSQQVKSGSMHAVLLVLCPSSTCLRTTRACMMAIYTNDRCAWSKQSAAAPACQQHCPCWTDLHIGLISMHQCLIGFHRLQVMASAHPAQMASLTSSAPRWPLWAMASMSCVATAGPPHANIAAACPPASLRIMPQQGLRRPGALGSSSPRTFSSTAPCNSRLTSGTPQVSSGSAEHLGPTRRTSSAASRS